MNRSIIKLVLIAGIAMMPACEDDFLERYPLDAVSEETFFNTADDLKTYVNGLYSALPFYHFQQAWANWDDVNADVQIQGRTITGELNQRASSGLAPMTDPAWDNRYSQIRRANFFLANYHRVDERNDAADHFVGEGYFFRAWHYYSLLAGYGGVPLILEPLNISDQELYRPRDSRYDVAKQIIKDLDSAIINLQWKGQGEALAGRVNKEAAIVMKARVALFEGTWEYYHASQGTVFAVPGKDGREFLEMIDPVVQELIDHQGTNIFRSGGPLNEPYNQLFAIEEGHSGPGLFWYRVYDTDLLASGGHNFYSKVTDTGMSITRRLVEMYLDVEGKPQEVSTRDLTTLTDMGQNLDPRFRQTIWTPDRGPLTQIPGRGAQLDLDLRYPVITEALEYLTATGFRRWKGAVLDESEFRAGETDDILIRYAEGLLAYAEAKAILGTITQADLDKTINVLRGRVNMQPMNLEEVNSWNIAYDAAAGFDPTAPNIVNEVRRERTVELALEGFRLTDLKRWAVYDEAINGYRPKGAHIQEFLDYFNDPAALASDGWTGTVDLSLQPGDYGVDANGFINPYFRSTQFQEGGEGFWINPDRDYLDAVPRSEIELYSQNGVNLTQNPGWN